MDYVSLSVAGLALFAVFHHAVVGRFIKSTQRFPTCRKCGKNMVKIPLTDKFPAEIQDFLDKHKLPPMVVSRYCCSRGCYQAWYIPRMGNEEKGLFVPKEF